MTKENLRDLFCKQLNSSQHWGDLSIFDEFFDSNVVIPRGANRHQYADVLHEWVEGYTECIFTHPNGSYRGIAKQIFTEYGNFKIEVYKPSEPVWEYQYLITTMFGASENKLSKFITDDEFASMARSRSEGWIKIEETKRERK